MKLSSLGAAIALVLGAAAALKGQNISLTEQGVGANEIVDISSSGVGNNLNVYAGVLDLTIDSNAVIGFCIDPWHWSGSGTMAYTAEQLGVGPDVGSGMGATVQKEIEQLWHQYYSASMSSSAAAGLQIAIWELVDGAINAQNSSYWFTLNSSNNYGAASMISWVESNVNAPLTNLVALTGPGQNYVVLQSSVSAYAPVVSNGSVSGIAGQSMTYSIVATNQATAYTASNLPAGLTLNSSSGVISGNPSTGGTYSVPITASNAGGTGSGTLTITVNYSLTISGYPSAAGTFTGAGTYAAGVTATITQSAASGFRTGGWSGPDAGSVAAPSSSSTTIPMLANRVLVSNYIARGTLTVNTTTGGTAAGSGTFDVGTQAPITATVTNSDYRFANWTGSGVANSSGTPTNVAISGNQTVTANFAEYAPVITSALTQSGIVGQSLNYTVTATHHPSSYAATNLPAGLSINTTTGVISGTPTIGGTFSVLIGATNAGGSGTATLTITVGVTLSITTSPAGAGTTSGAGTYTYATNAPITATPTTGYRAAGWSGTDASSVQNPSAASTLIAMTANRSIIANFVKQGTLTVVAGTGGNANGSGNFDVGSSAPIAASANTDYVFSGWTGSGIASSSSTSTTVSITGNETVTANFTMQPPVITSALALGANLNQTSVSYTITATHNPTSFNAVGLPSGLSVSTSTGAITGTPTAAGTFNVTISASNAGGTGTATLVITVAQTYTLSISGSPSSGGAFVGAGIYVPGTVVTVSETAANGYRTNGWSGTGASALASSGSPSTTITMNANYALTAVFVQQGTVTVTAGTGGSATGSGIFDVGTSAPIVATAAPGYVFVGWTGSSDVASNETATTTVNVTGNENVAANFTSSSNMEQLGTIVFPNAVPPGIPGYAATTSSMNAVVTNSSTKAVTIGELGVTGNFSTNVALPITLSPGASTSIPLTFAPQVLGVQTGTLTGVSNDSSTPMFQFTLQGTGVNPSSPPSATITAAASGYTGSPFYVSSTAFAPDNNLTQHSIEWMSPEGVWNVDTASASGGNSSRTLGISFTEVGNWTLRAGASVDGGQTWYYSPSVTVSVSSGTANYTLQSMAVPSASNQVWYSSSPVVQKTYQVLHTNPTTPGN